METYRVTAVQAGAYWELHVDGIGVTQSHGAGDAERMTRSYIALSLDVPPDSFRVLITPPETTDPNLRGIAGATARVLHASAGLARRLSGK